MESIQPLGIDAAIARIQEIATLLQPQSPSQPAASAGASAGFADQLAVASGGVPAGAAKTASAYASGGGALGLSGAVAPGLVTAAPAVGAAGQATAQQLDAWMREKVPGSPLVGLGGVFVREGRANGIDPRFLVAVAYHESVLGTAGSGRDINNAFGWGPAIPFGSWEENIARVAEGLADGYVGEGLTTVAEIQGKWAPVGASNDPSDLNSNWLRAVSETLTELGGDPAGSVVLGGPQAPAAAGSFTASPTGVLGSLPA